MRFTLIFILFTYTFVSFGQTDTSIYITTLGKYKCKPNFKGQYIDTTNLLLPVTHLLPVNVNNKSIAEEREEEWSNLISTLIPDGELKELPIYFPKRADTINYIYPDNTIKQKIEFIDHHTSFNLHDSIFSNSIDSLLNKKLTVVSNFKSQKVVNYTFYMLYSDGYGFTKTIKKNKIIKDKEIRRILKNHRIIYISIYNINIENRSGKRVSIFEGYGWKILNSH